LPGTSRWATLTHTRVSGSRPCRTCPGHAFANPQSRSASGPRHAQTVAASQSGGAVYRCGEPVPVRSSVPATGAVAPSGSGGGEDGFGQPDPGHGAAGRRHCACSGSGDDQPRRLDSGRWLRGGAAPSVAADLCPPRSNWISCMASFSSIAKGSGSLLR